MTRVPDVVAAGIRRSGYDRAEFAANYDRDRPRPPAVLAEVLGELAQVERPRLVVDLGSGTGLSTRLWADRADEVVGVEPSDAMRRVAEARTAELRSAANIRYVAGTGNRTGLPGNAADIVTCAQSLHWMEPTPTLAEIARVLRPGGVFAAYDYGVPPFVHWEVELAFMGVWAAALERYRALSADDGGERWPEDGRFDRIQASGHFRYGRTMSLHNRESGDAERLVRMLLGTGTVVRAMEAGLGEAELGVPRLREAAWRALGDREWPWLIGYSASVFVK